MEDLMRALRHLRYDGVAVTRQPGDTMYVASPTYEGRVLYAPQGRGRTFEEAVNNLSLLVLPAHYCGGN